ncbi:protein HID1 isoform X2 [Daktulosphaira vitifoliae]|uniref:protein HID1 isoform X2 n=1 Tax=Daktulosphaira vitifoliae TaxID=58002 RepID=UPI0021AA1E2D|nr:protein HID1 isoform X2 [Daktulosphaira vitifoliae]
MGNADTKLVFRKAVVQLTSKTQTISAEDDDFWNQFWSENVTNVQDVFTLVPAAEIRLLREDVPANLATLCYKAVEKFVKAVENSCRTQQDQNTVLNCSRLLTRILPYIFEDPDWENIFWSSLPAGKGDPPIPLAHSLCSALCDLLFCPDFTVASNRKNGPDKAEDLQAVDSCEYIWEKGVGFAQSPVKSAVFELNRTELLRLLLTCFSQAIYSSHQNVNRWVQYITSADNRHALPMLTSLLNTVCGYDPIGIGLPYNHLIFADTTEPLVDVCLQILIVSLDSGIQQSDDAVFENLFINYLSRIHRDEDFAFILNGFTRLLMNPLRQTYLPNSTKKVQFHQELLIFFWKICEFNKKFLYFVLKSSDVLDVLVPILYHLNDSRADQSRIGLMHIGVFILLLLSGERNFGVRLNKPYTSTIPMDIPVFSGTHADLLIVVFHKIITTGHNRMQPLFDCLLTILVNVSPYLKTLSMVSSTKLLHLMEAFTTPWFLFSSPSANHLVFFLLEIFNNIIQYQFDGNSNLVYTIIRKRQVFHSLANLPSDYNTIVKSMTKKSKKNLQAITPPNLMVYELPSMEGSTPALPAEPGTLNATLPDTPGVMKITERESAHPGNVTLPAELVSSNVITKEFVDQAYNEGESSPKMSSSKDDSEWIPTVEWVRSWKEKLPLQTIMRLLQVLVPQVEKICIDKGLTDESEILKFLQHGTLVGLLPVPHPILIRKYQSNSGTTAWFRTFMWAVIFLRNVDPPIWFDTEVKMFEIQRM